MDRNPIDPVALAGAKSKGKRPQYFDDPAVERVLSIAMALAGELAVTRERLDTLERLLEDKSVISRAEIEDYCPDRESASQRQALHEAYLARILRCLQQEREAIREGDGDRDLADIAREVSQP